jgi:ribose transport system permease protein
LVKVRIARPFIEGLKMSESEKTTPAMIRFASVDPQKLILPGIIVLIAVISGFIEPRYWTAQNLVNLGRQIAPLLILAAGQSLTVIAGGLDLSVAAVLALSGICGVVVMNKFGVAIGILAMLATGVGFGTLNGGIIARFKVSPFIATLGALSIARGLALIASGGLPIYDMPDAFVDNFGSGALLGVPAGVVIAVATVVVFAMVLRYTILGRYIYAIGSNTASAFHSGINVGAYTVLIYALSGLAAGIAAVVLTSYVAAAQPLAAQGLELQSLAAVVVGGVALTGGHGSMLNVFYGVVILGMLSNSLTMIGVSSFMQILAIGVVIVAAVILDQLRRSAN